MYGFEATITGYGSFGAIHFTADRSATTAMPPAAISN